MDGWVEQLENYLVKSKGKMFEFRKMKKYELLGIA